MKLYSVPLDSVEISLMNGEVYNNDLVLLENYLFNFETKKLNLFIYKEAVIFGTSFKSRGIECREDEEAKGTRTNYGQQRVVQEPRKSCNNIFDLKALQSTCSSWFSFRLPSFNADKLLVQVGQFNGFFRLHFTKEPLLHGLPLASMTGRVSQRLEKSSLIKVSCGKGESYLHDHFFVPLTQVYGTQLGILALGNDDEYNEKLISQAGGIEKSSLKSLLFIELQSYRKCIVYEANEREKYNDMTYDEVLRINI